MTEVTPKGSLSVTDLRYGYGDREILRGLSLEAARGEILGIIGPNGAGKSTLLRLLSGIAQPADGEVRLEGRSVLDWDRAELARALTTVFQSETIPFPFTVHELVSLGRFPHTPRGLGWQAQDREVVRQVLARLELEDFARRRFATLSGGEQKRVLLARALVQEPRFLLLDEPTAALDMRHQLETMAFLGELRSQREMGIVVVLHDLNLVAQYCDRVVILHDGKARAVGKPADVLVYGLLKEVFGVELYVGVNEVTKTLHLHPMKGSRA